VAHEGAQVDGRERGLDVDLALLPGQLDQERHPAPGLGAQPSVRIVAPRVVRRDDDQRVVELPGVSQLVHEAADHVVEIGELPLVLLHGAPGAVRVPGGAVEVDPVDAAEGAVLVEDEGRVRQGIMDEREGVGRQAVDRGRDPVPHLVAELEPVGGEEPRVGDAEQVAGQGIGFETQALEAMERHAAEQRGGGRVVGEAAAIAH
jgi:hypothetical protein